MCIRDRLYLFRKVPPNQRYWAKIQYLAKWAGLPLIANQTPLEWSDLISKSVGNASHFRVLATSYNAVRYGNPETTYTSNEIALISSYNEIKKILLQRIIAKPIVKLRNLLPFINAK